MAKWNIHEIWNLLIGLLVVEMLLSVFTYNLFQHGYWVWVEYSWMLGIFLFICFKNGNKACRYIVANNRLNSIYCGSRHRLECEIVYAERQMDVRASKARPVIRWAWQIMKKTRSSTRAWTKLDWVCAKSKCGLQSEFYVKLGFKDLPGFAESWIGMGRA